MQTNVLEYLENTVDRVPDKTAFADEESALSFIQVSEQAKSIGTELSRQGAYREPVVVYMKKCPQTIAAFFGVIYAVSFAFFCRSGIVVTPQLHMVDLTL